MALRGSISKTFVLNIAASYHGNGDAYALILILTDLRDINIIVQSLEKTKFDKRSNDEKLHS